MFYVFYFTVAIAQCHYFCPLLCIYESVRINILDILIIYKLLIIIYKCQKIVLYLTCIILGRIRACRAVFRTQQYRITLANSPCHSRIANCMNGARIQFWSLRFSEYRHAKKYHHSTYSIFPRILPTRAPLRRRKSHHSVGCPTRVRGFVSHTDFTDARNETRARQERGGGDICQREVT